MSARIMCGNEAGMHPTFGNTCAVIYDSVTERPLPIPMFRGHEAHELAEAFIVYVERKTSERITRVLHTDLDRLHNRFVAEQTCKRCGELVTHFEMHRNIDGCV